MPDYDLGKNKWIYTEKEVNLILKAYRMLFANSNTISEYFDFANKRRYSLIASDFRKLEYKDYLEVNNIYDEIASYENINNNLDDEIFKDLKELNEANIDNFHNKLNDENRKAYFDTIKNIQKLSDKKNKLIELVSEIKASIGDNIIKPFRDLKIKNSIGTAIGINPLTDDLLIRSNLESKDVIIFLGNDFYPILTANENNEMNYYINSPVYVYSLFTHPQFQKCFPEGTYYYGSKIIASLLKSKILLYLNFYPDFRHPFANQNEYFYKPDLDYDKCKEYFNGLCYDIHKNGYNINGIVTFGGTVLSQFSEKNIMETVDKEIKKIVKQEKIKIDNVPDITHLAYYHPYNNVNFNSEHRREYFKGLESLIDSSIIL